MPTFLSPGGRLILSMFPLEKNRTSPTFSVMFALEMLVLTPAGRAYTMEEISSRDVVPEQEGRDRR
jgi:hypothetical protein